MLVLFKKNRVVCFFAVYRIENKSKHMKKTLIVLVLVISQILITQVQAQSFNYQAVVRDISNALVVNQSIGVQLKIIEGSPTGTIVYTERHSFISNAYGVISLSIGTGTTTDNFSTIDWSTQNYWLNIGVDITGGTTYVIMGTSKLQQVPYAMYAHSSGDKAFSTIASVTSNAPGTIAIDDFVFGSTQLANDNGTSDDDFRMFFDKSKGAFRAGISPQNTWDDVNVGINSAAFGNQTIASNFQSFAAGAFNTASGSTSTVFGNQNIVSGDSGFATGEHLTSEARNQVSLGYYNTPVAGTATGVVATDRLLVVGNGTFSNRSDAFVMLKNGNTTLNGSLTIDSDNQGVGKAYTLPAQDGAANQVMTTNGSGAVSWTDTAALSGAFSTTNNVTSNAPGTMATDDFVFGSTQLDRDTATPDNHSRFFFNKSKSAFRAGYGNTTNWDDVNIGDGSTAFGWNSIASGNGSFSTGSFNESSGRYATSFGQSNIAGGVNSFASGAIVTAESFAQTSIGMYSTVETGNANTYVTTDRLFVIGNGTGNAARSNALTVLKNGNTTLNGQLTIDGDNQGAGTPYTLPAQGGTNGQLLGVSALGVQWLDADEVVPDITNLNNTSITTTALTVTNLPTFSANIITGMAVSSAGWTKASETWRTSGTSGLHNNGSYFNIGTGDFTAPVDGFYMFSAQVRIDGMNTGYVRLLIAINNNTDVNNGLHAIRNSETASASFDTMSVSGVVQLSAGDTVSIYIQSSSDTSFTIQGESGFNGYLVSRL
ncbi:MAG: hypothetical protein COA88_03140 [Kordia sp.]|nr:MAG: hypothetical protein COA88_03140 [Kordia sp.]